MKTIEELKAIVGAFDVQGSILEIKPLGNGLINDTLLVRTDGPDDYVLQRVNNAIFKDVDLLQHNIDCATAHIRRKLAGDPDIDRKVLTFIPCKATGKTYWTDGETSYANGETLPAVTADVTYTAEFDELSDYVKGSAYDLQAMGYPAWPNATDAYGFSARPAGFYAISSATKFGFQDSTVLYWSSLERDEDFAYRLAVTSSASTVMGAISKEMAISVRCIKD